jgi:hypothetical protein
MAVITNYATLQTEIANTLSRDDLTAEIPQFVQFAENRLYRTLNLRNEETALNVAISSGVAAVPSDFKMLKFAYYSQTPAVKLEWVPLEQLYDEYPDRSSTETPRLISREADNFVFGPVAPGGTLAGVYYAKQDPLRTTDPSWYVTNAPEVLLYGSLIEAAPFIQDDERLPTWERLYATAVESLRMEDKNAQRQQSGLMQRVS